MPASAAITAAAIAHGWTIVPAPHTGPTMTYERGASRVHVTFHPTTGLARRALVNGHPVSPGTGTIVRALAVTHARSLVKAYA
jgi:hypothetical protein